MTLSQSGHILYTYTKRFVSFCRVRQGAFCRVGFFCWVSFLLSQFLLSHPFFWWVSFMLCWLRVIADFSFIHVCEIKERNIIQSFIVSLYQVMHDYIVKSSIVSTESDTSTSENTKARIWTLYSFFYIQSTFHTTSATKSQWAWGGSMRTRGGYTHDDVTQTIMSISATIQFLYIHTKDKQRLFTQTIMAICKSWYSIG